MKQYVFNFLKTWDWILVETESNLISQPPVEDLNQDNEISTDPDTRKTFFGGSKRYIKVIHKILLKMVSLEKEEFQK